MPPGRNEPCPCGSGLKYKRCHGAPWTAEGGAGRSEQNADAIAERLAAAAQAHDTELVVLLLRFSRTRLGADWMDKAMVAYAEHGDPGVDQSELQLAVPWALHGYPAGTQDESVSSLYREAKGRHLSFDLRALLDAQIASWCSLWVVEKVQQGKGASLRDLLSDERRYVHERLGTEGLAPDLVLLARVVDVSGISFLAGLHPQPLPSDRTFDLVSASRRHFRVRTRPVKPERLRDSEFQHWLIGEWRALATALSRPPTLANTDGDPLTLTVDHFIFDVARRDDLIARLVAIPGAELAEDGAEEGARADAAERSEEAGVTEIVVTRAGNRRHAAMDHTITGVLRVGAGKMQADTNSTRRADALRKAVTKAAGALVRHRLREETSTKRMLSEIGARAERGEPLPPRPEHPPEALEALREFKRRHYASWVDESIPALGGLTPRAAARSARMREQLENLLRRFEQSEAKLPEGERGDVSAIRRELGM